MAKTKKLFILAPERARTVLNVFLECVYSANLPNFQKCLYGLSSVSRHFYELIVITFWSKVKYNVKLIILLISLLIQYILPEMGVGLGGPNPPLKVPHKNYGI